MTELVATIAQPPTASAQPIAPLLYGVDPQGSLAQGAVHILRTLQETMEANEAGVIQGSDPIALHEMRVAIRRSRVALSIFRASLGRNQVKPYRKSLRRVGQVLGEVRDYDVFLEYTYRYLNTIALNRRSDLTPLIRWLLGRRVAARLAMMEYLKSHEFHGLMKSYTSYLADPFAASEAQPVDQVSVHLAAPGLVDRQLRRALVFPSRLTEVTFVELHELRIAFKRLRYTLEFFREIFGQDTEEAIFRLKDVQDHLGYLNDAHVACNIIVDSMRGESPFDEGAPLLEGKKPDEIVEYLAVQNARRNFLLNTFNDSWEQFRSYEIQRVFAAIVSPPAPEYQRVLALSPAA